MEIEFLSVHRCWIDLEVAGVDDVPNGSFDRQGKGVHDRVRDLEELNREASDGDLVLGLDRVEMRLLEHAVLLELALDQGHGEGRTVDRNVEVRKNEGKRADVVFVAVCEEDGFDFAFPLEKVTNVGNDDVDAQQFFVGKHDAGVDHNDRFLAPECHHVHAEFAESTKSDNFK